MSENHGEDDPESPSDGACQELAETGYHGTNAESTGDHRNRGMKLNLQEVSNKGAWNQGRGKAVKSKQDRE